MKLLLTEDQFSVLKSRDAVPLMCEHCSSTFYQPKHQVHKVLVGKSNNTLQYCSRSCKHLAQTTRVSVTCTNCGTVFHKTRNQAIRSENHFCCQSCAGTYNNAHRNYGYRRSKAEIYIEEKINTHFPEVTVIPNDKKAIGRELDLYFPQLKLAIELNGIFHYIPVYGEETLHKIETNDLLRKEACLNAGIRLVTVDISWINRFTPSNGEKLWSLIEPEIQESIYGD